MIKTFFTNIMVAVNGSDASIAAAKYAIVLAKAYQCKLSAVYVVDTAAIRKLSLSKMFIQEESQEFEMNLQSDGDRYLDFVEELAQAKGISISKIIRQGAVSTEILAAADDKRADLLIMGGWEKDRGPKDIVYTTYREIMANSKCSVLLAKDPYIDQMYKQA